MIQNLTSNLLKAPEINSTNETLKIANQQSVNSLKQAIDAAQESVRNTMMSISSKDEGDKDGITLSNADLKSLDQE